MGKDFQRQPEVKALLRIERALAPLSLEAQRRILYYFASAAGLTVFLPDTTSAGDDATKD